MACSVFVSDLGFPVVPVACVTVLVVFCYGVCSMVFVNKMRRIEGASGSSSNAVGSIDSQEMSMTTHENSAAGGSQLLYESSTQNLISTTSQPPQAVETLQMPVNQLQHIEGTQSLAISGSSTQQTTEWAAF
ncbi:hypothetical protein Q3G72_001146 [Acer saccharum]|nr:hypothetical protein Q3G72_001146 [Acer saccharum]